MALDKHGCSAGTALENHTTYNNCTCAYMSPKIHYMDLDVRLVLYIYIYRYIYRYIYIYIYIYI